MSELHAALYGRCVACSAVTLGTCQGLCTADHSTPALLQSLAPARFFHVASADAGWLHNGGQRPELEMPRLRMHLVHARTPWVTFLVAMFLGTWPSRVLLEDTSLVTRFAWKQGVDAGNELYGGHPAHRGAKRPNAVLETSRISQIITCLYCKVRDRQRQAIDLS